MPKVNFTVDEYGDMRDEGWEPLFPKPIPQGLEASKRLETVGQKSEESIMVERRATPLAQSPASADPPCRVCQKVPRRTPSSDYCQGCWDERERTGIVPKLADEIRSVSINP
jgi:hypothetical protein